MKIMAPRNTSLQAWLWILQILTGLGLCLYVVIHMVDVGTIILGKHVYEGLAHKFEIGSLAPLITLVLWLVGIAVILHSLNGFRVASKPYREPAVMYRHLRGLRHRGTWFWIFQVMSGSALVAFLAIHYFVIHGTAGGIIDFASSSARMHNPWFVVLYVATLFVLLYHTINGFRSVLVKTGVLADAAKENKFLKALYGVGLVIMIISVVAIIRFLTMA